MDFKNLLIYFFENEFKILEKDLINYNLENTNIYLYLDKIKDIYFLKANYLINYLKLSKNNLEIKNKLYKYKIKKQDYLPDDLVLYDIKQKKIVFLIKRKFEKLSFLIQKNKSIKLFFEDDNLFKYHLKLKDVNKNKFNALDVYTGIVSKVENFNITLSKIVKIGQNKEDNIFIKNLISKSNLDINSDNAEKLDFEIKSLKSSLSKYKDLTNKLSYTLDTKHAKDFDDAISLIRLKDNSYNLKIHIAAIANYISKESELFKLALKKVFSLYTFTENIFMFPEKITSDILSLKKDKISEVITADFTFDQNLNLIKKDIYKAKIKVSNNFKFTDKNIFLKNEIKLLLEFYNKFKNISLFKDKINFNENELKFEYQNNIVNIYTEKDNIFNEVIEKLMVFTNYQLSLYFKENNLDCIYRIHDLFDLSKINSYKNYLSNYQIDINNLDKNRLNELISNLNHNLKIDNLSKNLINDIFLSMQQKAIYNLNQGYHFALGITSYTHYTAPIRRLPDLLNQMILSNFLDNKKPSINKIELDNYLKIINETELKHQSFYRSLTKLGSILYLKNYKNKTFNGIITAFLKNGFRVKLDNNIEGFVNYNSLNEYFYFDIENNKAVNNLNFSYNIGDIVKVKLKKINYYKLFIDFIIVE